MMTLPAMMPDLGKYAFYVLSAYGVSIALLLGLVVLTIRRGRRVRAEMEAIESRQTGDRADG